MNRARHIGIVAVSAEGAALCYRTICTEGAAVLGPHDHPQVTMHTYPLAEYMQHVEAIRFTRLWISCTRRRPRRGFNIAEEVAAVATARGFKRLGILGTRPLMEGPVYREKLAVRGIEQEIPEADDRNRINAIIFDELVYGRFEETSRSYLRAVIEVLGARGCDAVVLACTEIPLLLAEGESPLPAIDSTRTLARAALREATRNVSA